MVDELVHSGAAVGAHQHPVPHAFGQLGQGVGEHRDVVGGVVRAGLALAQHPRHALTGAARAVIEERQQPVEPERALPRRRGAFLVRVRHHQRRVDIHYDQFVIANRGTVRPHPRPSRRPRGSQRRQRRRPVRSQRGDQPRHRRIGGDRPEQLRLRTRHPQIGQTVPAQRDRHRQIPHDLARMVLGTPRPPRCQLLAQRRVQAADLARAQQQRRTRRADQRLATDHYPNTTPPPVTVHLRSASQLRASAPSTSSRIPSRAGTSCYLRPVSRQHINLTRKIEVNRPATHMTSSRRPGKTARTARPRRCVRSDRRGPGGPPGYTLPTTRS